MMDKWGKLISYFDSYEGTHNIMSDVFLSYDRSDSARAEIIRYALENIGLDVVTSIDEPDASGLTPDVQERKIRTAGAVLSLWNTRSLSHEWLRAECEIARKENSLIPLETGNISESVLTVSLSKVPRLPLQDFEGRSNHPEWKQIVRLLARTMKRPGLVKALKERAKEEARAAKLARKRDKQNARDEKRANGQRGFARTGKLTLASATIAALGLGGWTTVEWQAEQTQSQLIPAELRAQLKTFDVNVPYGQTLLSDMLANINVRALVEAAPDDPQAALLAGWAFEYGEGGITKSVAEAVRLYRLSCANENMPGCRNLGMHFANGVGVEEDDFTANSLYMTACNSGDMSSCYNLAVHLANGVGIEADKAAAHALYRKACYGGNLSGCNSLGSQFTDEVATIQGPITANTEDQQACEKDATENCSTSNRPLHQAGGITDAAQASWRLLTKSCNDGNQLACNRLAADER